MSMVITAAKLALGQLAKMLGDVAPGIADTVILSAA